MNWAIAGFLIGTNITVMVAVSAWRFLPVQALKTEMRDLRQEIEAE